jgi:hypothetical protein
MNTNFLAIIKRIVSEQGEAILAEPQRLKGWISDYAKNEPKAERLAFGRCIEYGAYTELKNASPKDRAAVKSRLAQKLHNEEGLDPALCAGALDVLEAAIFEANGIRTALPYGLVCPSCGAALLDRVRFCAFCGAAVSPDAAGTTVTANSALQTAPHQQLVPAASIRQKKEIWRELQTINRYTERQINFDTPVVDFVMYSPDGRRIVSYDGVIKIWDAESGRELHTLDPECNILTFLAYSPDGRRIISGPKGIIWDSERGRKLKYIGRRGMFRAISINSAVYSPDGYRIIGLEDGTIKIWEAETGRELQILSGEYRRVIPVANSLDRWIASLSEDGTIKIWEVETGCELNRFKGFRSAWSIAYRPDGRIIIIVSGLWHNAIKIWDAESGHELHTLTGHTEGVISVACSPGGDKIVSGSYDNTIKIWDAENGHELYTLTGHTGGVKSVAYSPSGDKIVSGSSDHTIKIWGVD